MVRICDFEQREPRNSPWLFPFSWEQRRLGDVCDSFEYGLNAAAKEFDGINKYIRITDIDDSTHVFLTTDITSPATDISHADRYKLQDGDIVFARTGASVGKTYLYDNKDGIVYFAGFLIRAKVKKGHCSEFVFQATLSDGYSRYIAVTSQRSGQPGVNASEYQDWEFFIPKNSAEQEKIGTFFRSLDRLITLHQRKQFCICPKFGIFHNEKTNAWEQRKLGEIVERIVRKNTNLESTLPLTISAQYGLVDQITYFNNRVASRDVSGYYLVLNGEFAYNKSTSDGFPFGAIKRLDLYPKGVLSTLYIVFSIRDREQTSSDYLTVLFDTDRWHRGVSERAAEGARNHGLLNISAEDFFDISIHLPKETREQEKIGTFFRNLDRLITLHQRKPLFLFLEELRC